MHNAFSKLLVRGITLLSLAGAALPALAVPVAADVVFAGGGQLRL